MKQAKLSARTVNKYVEYAKQVVASLIDGETGEPIHKRTWNSAVMVVGSRTGAMPRRCGLAVAPRFLWVGIELGRASLEGGGLPSSPFRSAWRGHNSTKAAFPEAPYNAGCPNFSGPV